MKRFCCFIACLATSKESLLMAYGIREQELFTEGFLWVHGVFAVSWLITGIVVAVKGTEA